MVEKYHEKGSKSFEILNKLKIIENA